MLPRLRRRRYSTALLLLLVAAAAGAGADCPEDSLLGEDGTSCKCIPASFCPRPLSDDCPPGTRRMLAREGLADRPGSCCPLYECREEARLKEQQRQQDEQQAWLAASANRMADEQSQWCVDGQGQPRGLGEHWLETDPCTNCSCPQPGRPRCQTTMCRSCPQPEPRAPNECCPRCPALLPANPAVDDDSKPSGCPAMLHDCPLRDQCPHGLLRDPSDCEVCQCRPSPRCPPRVACPSQLLGLQLPGKRCPRGYRLDKTSGCPICQCLGSCLDEDKLRRLEGERWSHDPCRSCLCGPAGAVSCNLTVCSSLGCGRASPAEPPPGHCCPLCPPLQETVESGVRSGWGTVPIVLIVLLALLCLILMVHLVRNRFRARLDPREIDFAGFSQYHLHHHQQQQQHQQQNQLQQQQQYYKCLPAYEPVLRHADKIAPL